MYKIFKIIYDFPLTCAKQNNVNVARFHLLKKVAFMWTYFEDRFHTKVSNFKSLTFYVGYFRMCEIEKVDKVETCIMPTFINTEITGQWSFISNLKH